MQILLFSILSEFYRQMSAGIGCFATLCSGATSSTISDSFIVPFVADLLASLHALRCDFVIRCYVLTNCVHLFVYARVDFVMRFT